MRRRTIIAVVLVVAALTVGLVLYLCARMDDSRVTVTSTGPLDIRLWGIRPDAGDAIYDLNGKKIMETLGIGGGAMPLWGTGVHRRDFIFEMSDLEEPVLIYRLRHRVGGATFWEDHFPPREFHFEREGRTLWWVQTGIPRTIGKSFLFGVWKRTVPVDKIDLNLQYYCGPPRKPICLFKGPFEVGKTFVDETGLYKIFLMEYGSSTPPVLDVHLYTGRRVDAGARALSYDAKGKRLWAASHWSPADPDSPVIRYRLLGLPPKEIAMITIGEEPFEITVSNLRMRSPNGENRTHAERFDRIAERLDLELDPERLARHRFKSLDDALKVLDVIRGDQIPNVCKSLSSSVYGKSQFERANLSAEQLQRLRRTVLRWAGAMDPEIRAAAAELGLDCGWPEFVDVALNIIEYPDRHRSWGAGPTGDAVKGLADFRELLSERDVERIAEIITRHTDVRIINGLRKCLEHRKSPARVTAMWDLAAGEHPWLWCPAITQLSTWGELDGKHDSLPEELKVRVFLKLGPSGFSDLNQIAPKACDLLLSLLSSELLTQQHRAYASLLENVPENVDRRAMTDVMIESLRNAEYGSQGYSFSVAISKIVKHLNLWHDVDIGGLNSDTKKRDATLYRKHMDTVASKAVEWYDTVYLRGDPNSVQ